MSAAPISGRRSVCNRAAIGFSKALAVALFITLVLPARAGDDRAVKSRVAPIYPEIAKRMKIEGEVKLEATVDADGKVKNVKAVTGNRVLQVAAEDAVRKWRFETGTGDTLVVVAVNFAINP